MSLLSRYDETGEMRSFPLMFLFMIVYCSLVSSEDTISISDRRNDRFWLNPFDRFSNASTPRKLESQQEDDWKFYHPDDLKLLHSRWNKNQNIIPELQISKGQYRPITKIVEELFPGFKSTTTSNKKKESSESNDKIKFPKPFWGPSVLIPSVRPWFHTTQATSNLPYTREQATPEISIPLEKREPSNPFWGPPIGTSSTWSPPYTKTTAATVPTQEKEEFFFLLSNGTDTDEGITLLGPIAEVLRQSYELSYNQPIAQEHFREQVHLKPGPPYHEKQEENDFMDQNVWHAIALTEPTIVGNPISTEPQQQLEPEIVIHQQHYPGFDPNLEVSHLAKEIDTTALASYKNPSSYPHSKPKPHIVYHHQPAPQHYNHYRPSGLTHVDFSPIFLAIVPIALFLGAAAAFALASAVTSSSAVATAQQQQQQQEESNNNNNNDNNNNNNNNINTILALLAAFHEVKKHHDNSKIVIITTPPNPETIAELANEVQVTTVSPLPPPPPTGPFFVKLLSSTTESPPALPLPYGHYERKKITYHHMNGIT